MKKTAKIIVASATLLISMSACASKNKDMKNESGMDSVHKATVAFENQSHPLSFTAGKLSANEENSLAAFAAASGLSYADRLTLRVSEPNMATDYRHAINTVLGRFGLAIGNVEATTGIAPGTAVLAISRAAVTLPECGKQTGPHGGNFNNENMNNYGCATRSNLAAMAANPADLISGNTLDGQTTDVTANPIKVWNKQKAGGAEAAK
jgi:pilus assembly protein CpaD